MNQSFSNTKLKPRPLMQDNAQRGKPKAAAAKGKGLNQSSNSNAPPRRRRRQRRQSNVPRQQNMAVARQMPALNARGGRSDGKALYFRAQQAHFTQAQLNVLRTILDPTNYYCRGPNPNGSKTALVRSMMSFPLSVDYSADASGKFSFVVSPTIGADSNNPLNWKVSLCNSPIPENLSIPASFQQFIGGKDLAIDPLFGSLTRSGVGIYSQSVISSDGIGILGPDSTVDYQQSLPVVITNIPATMASLGDSQINAPIGQYWCDIYYELAAAVDGGIPFNISFGTTTNITPVYDESGTLSAPTTNLYRRKVFILDITAIDTVHVTSGALDNYPLHSTFSMQQVFIPGLGTGFPPDNGLMEKYRPIACSVLLTSTTAAILNGGIVTSALIPQNLLKSQYYSAVPNNSLSDYTNLEVINGRPASSEQMKDGKYQTWVPDSELQYNFFAPSDAAQIPQYPQIVVSGFAPYSGTSMDPGVQQIARVQIVSVYELYTADQLLETEFGAGTLDDFQRVHAWLQTESLGMPNGPHNGIISKAMDFASKFIQGAVKVAPVLIQGAKMVGF